jgi:tRNA (guanine-N7-)-methyltransferase
LNDYAYVLKYSGRIYTITDVKELHEWHTQTLDSSPHFKRIEDSLLTDDMFIGFMRNTDEAKKVAKKKGDMFFAVYEKILPKITSVKALYNILK